MSELLRCEGLSKRYGQTLALDHVDLTLESGKIVALLGPNGSGKTTLIKIINGLLTPTAGQVTIDGHLPGPESKKLVAYLPDNSYLNSWMTVKQIVEYFTDFYEDFLYIGKDGKWDAGLIQQRSERICGILWERVKSWLD